MPNQVEILISAVDKASAVLGKMGGGGVIGSFTELNSALSLVKQAAQMVGQAYDETVGKTLAYDLQVRKLAQNLGLSTEETSRLIEVSDEAGVSIDSVTTALQMMVRRGTAPSIEELAKIADQYNAIKDPVKQAALMVELLGRNWTQLTPLLREGGDAIRANAAATLQGNIVTEAQAEAANHLREETVKLQEQWTAFRNTFANSIVPDLVRAFEDLNKASEWFTKQDPSKPIGSIGVAAGMSADQVARLKRELELAQTPAEHLAELEAGYKKLADSYGYIVPEVKSLTTATEDNLTTEDKWLKHMEAEKEVTSNLTAEQNRLAYDRESLRLITEQLTTEEGNLSTAENQLKTDQQNLNNAMGSEAVSAIDKANQSYERTLEAQKIADQAFGTHTAEVTTRTKEISDATHAFMVSPQAESDKATYLARLETIKTKYSDLDTAIEADKVKIGELQTKIDSLAGKVIYIDVITRYSEGGTPAPYGHLPIQPNAPTPAAPVTSPIGLPPQGPQFGSPTYNYSLIINSNARTEQVAADFALMKSLHSPGG